MENIYLPYPPGNGICITTQDGNKVYYHETEDSIVIGTVEVSPPLFLIDRGREFPLWVDRCSNAKCITTFQGHHIRAIRSPKSELWNPRYTKEELRKYVRDTLQLYWVRYGECPGKIFRYPRVVFRLINNILAEDLPDNAFWMCYTLYKMLYADKFDYQQYWKRPEVTCLG